MNDFLNEWLSHPEYWFDGNDDFICEKYGGLLKTEVWDVHSLDIRHHLSFIILYDQLPRHLYRKSDPDNIVSFYLKKALYIYNFIYKNAEFNIDDLTAIEWCFYNLPIRHNKEPNDIIRVIRDTWNRLKKNPDEKQYVRFLKSTYHRLEINQKEFIEFSSGEYTVTSFSDYVELLSNYPLVVNNVNITEESIVYKTIEKFVVKNNLDDIIISLSGGVDSMVCATILKKLQNKYDFNLVAVHIDYANRTYKECEFVKKWCAFMKIPLYTRHITEINRKDCMEHGMRKTYEDYTKKVRFETYKAVSIKPKVILGHNYDDCFENILTNICNRDKYDNLKGINQWQFHDNIQLLRPMLDIKKKEIYLFAYNNKIPYLQDSTPEWSQRGQIRDSVRPVLNKWNREMIPSFFDLSTMLTEYETIINSVVNNLIINIEKDVFKIPCGPMILSKIIWKHILQNLSIYISYRSLENLIQKIENIYYNLKYQKNSKRKGILNKTTTIQYSIGDGFLTIRIFRHM
jgi:tRNA(Ile)-lysidine synthetase-like protein